jgi:hypothetical protein
MARRSPRAWRPETHGRQSSSRRSQEEVSRLISTPITTAMYRGAGDAEQQAAQLRQRAHRDDVAVADRGEAAPPHHRVAAVEGAAAVDAVPRRIDAGGGSKAQTAGGILRAVRPVAVDQAFTHASQMDVSVVAARCRACSSRYISAGSGSTAAQAGTAPRRWHRGEHSLR